MADRITNQNLQNICDHYAATLVEVGVCTEGQVDGITVAQPYGQVYYVCRYVPGNSTPVHDVPGFYGSNDGFATKREAFDAVRRASATIHEALSPYYAAKRNEAVAA